MNKITNFNKSDRIDGREDSQIRNIKIHTDYLQNSQGSVLIEYGNTKVLCAATINPGVPRFLIGSKTGWLTAEYSMLPSATSKRNDREAVKGKQSGRTQEIQRLIGRSLRSSLDLKLLGENTIIIDCDVLQADGSTRTASITGACVALFLALKKNKKIKKNPILCLIAAVSVGVYQNRILSDLNYHEDSQAETDMNVVMNDKKGII